MTVWTDYTCETLWVLIIGTTHPRCENEEPCSVHDVTEHYAEKERERNCSKDSWINFFIAGNSVGVDNFLKGIEELIFPK